ncbi:MurR/RpiR family transcriptional regulator [Lachnospiraceae bacterium ZAX-1]
MSIEFQSRVKSYYQDLSEKEKALATYLLTESSAASRQSIKEISNGIGISVATTSRFAKKIGYKNFQDMKLAVSHASAEYNSFFSSIDESDSSITIADKTFETSMRSLQATRSMLNEKTLEQADQYLQKAHTFALFGLGGSSVITLEAYHKFLRTPLNCCYNQDFHMQLMQAAKMTEKDVALIVSHTGRNKEVLKIAQILKEKKIPIICITSYPGSPLATLSTVALVSIAEETTYRPEAVSSMVAQLALVDSLFLIYANHQKAGTLDTIKKIRNVIRDTRV